MTVPMRATPRLSAIPATQNTAPVHEFRCLFTHDFRRKQKRWQDGYLKFHVFNSRVMVYDTSGNSVGSTYWKDSNELAEGDELTLDNHVMVDVSEAKGVSQTDLTPLLERKSNGTPHGKASMLQQKPMARPSLAPTPARGGTQLRHKSLNSLLGTAKGPIGKAVAIKSPHDLRKENQNRNGNGNENETGWMEGRGAKRRKTDHEVVDLRSSSPVREATTPRPPLPLWETPSHARKARPVRPQKPLVANASSEIDNILSDVSLPSISPVLARRILPPTALPPDQLSIRKEPPFQPARDVTRRKGPLPRPRMEQSPARTVHIPPLGMQSTRVVNTEVDLEPIQVPPKEPSPPSSPKRNPKAKALRLSTGTRRAMLLCQSLPSEQPRSAAKPPKKKAKKQKRTEAPAAPAFEPVPWLSDQHGEDEPLISKNASTSESPPIVTKRKRKEPVPSLAPDKRLRKRSRLTEASPQSSPDASEDMELVHGLMDQQLIVLSESPEPRSRTPTVSPVFPRTIRPTADSAKKRAPEQRVIRDSPPMTVAAHRSPRTPTAPPRDPSLDPQVEPIKSASTSPRKPLNSTRSFRRKLKPALAQPLILPPHTPPSDSKTTPPNLPSHPITANRVGPLMSTTELGALLQRPHKPARMEEDPIEDASQRAVGTELSPNRSFRRVYSANDAPIPSISKDWEQHNLPPPEPDPKAEATMSKSAKKSGLADLINRTDPRKRYQRTQSLNVVTDSEGLGNDTEESDIVTPPVDKDIGPWSTEAFDLFDWRPPPKAGEHRGVGWLADE